MHQTGRPPPDRETRLPALRAGGPTRPSTTIPGLERVLTIPAPTAAYPALNNPITPTNEIEIGACHYHHKGAAYLCHSGLPARHQRTSGGKGALRTPTVGVRSGR